MYYKFPVTREGTHGEFGAIRDLNLKYTLTPLPCITETNVLKLMCSLAAILFYKFVCNYLVR